MNIEQQICNKVSNFKNNPSFFYPGFRKEVKDSG